MLLKETTHQTQSRLADYCRTGLYEPIAGVDPERAAVYRELVWNTVSGALEKAYPITWEWLGAEKWDELTSDFFAQWNSSTPYFWMMPKELYLFVEQEGGARWGIPYLRDLLFFEWIEIELFMMADRKAQLHRQEGDLMRDPLVLNPEGRIDAFQYPVYRSQPEELGDSKGSYFLFSYRHPVDLEVCFIELSPVCAVMVELLMQSRLSGEELVGALIEQFGLEEGDEIYRFTENFLTGLLSQGAVLGFREDLDNA
jgi:uncharacterized protein